MNYPTKIDLAPIISALVADDNSRAANTIDLFQDEYNNRKGFLRGYSNGNHTDTLSSILRGVYFDSPEDTQISFAYEQGKAALDCLCQLARMGTHNGVVSVCMSTDKSILPELTKFSKEWGQNLTAEWPEYLE